MPNLRFAPEFQIRIDDAPIPATLRASISSISHQTGLEGADRVEVTLVNENLRWLDDPLLRLDNSLTLSLGYAPDPLTQVFVGEIVGQNATFPSGGGPTLTVVAQDRLQRLQKSRKVRWFAIKVPSVGNFPLPDPLIARAVSLENLFDPVIEPIGAALAVLVGGVQAFSAIGNPDEMQKVIRKQVSESDLDFLSRISRENGWEMYVDHSQPMGGYKLRFMSPLDDLSEDLTLKYGQSLIDFTPRISNVGQIAGVTVNIWRPEIKMEFTVHVSWDWDRQSLNLSISPGFGLPGVAQGTPEALLAAASRAGAEGQQQAREDVARLDQPATEEAFTLVDEPVTATSAPRIILSKLLPKLNQRLTGTGNTIGDPRIQAGTVLRLEGVGEQFGGLYRVTSATHSVDSGGYRTSFEVRKDIWFGSIPPIEQGAVRVSLQGQRIG